MFIIYIKPNCTYSMKALKLIVKKRLSHKIITIQSEEQRNVIKRKHNFYTFPQIFYHSTFIGGYDNLRTYICN